MDLEEQSEPTERMDGNNDEENLIRNNPERGDEIANIGPSVSLEEDNYVSLPLSETSEEMHDAESQPERAPEPMVDVGNENQEIVEANTDNENQERADESANAGPSGRRGSNGLEEADLSFNRYLLNLVPIVTIEEEHFGDDDNSPQEEAQFEAIDLRIPEDDLESNSSDIVFDDEPPVRNGLWSIPAGRVYAAISELLTEGRRGEGGGNQIGNLLNPDTHMQYMRRLLYRVGVSNIRDHRRRGSNGDGSNLSISGDNETAEREEEEEEEPENPIRFDTNLAAEHSYLGSNMSRVSGVNYLEEGQHYNLMLFMHQHVLFPGELLPFMISEALIESDIDDQNGLLFGVCFPFMNDTANEANNLYGVTCQIYEKGTDERGNTLIKSRALQRFVIKTSALTGPAPFITVQPQAKCYGLVKILPEIYLPEPLQCINMGSMYRFRDNPSMAQTYRRFQAATTPWPAQIYDNYNMSGIVDMARTQLAQHKIDTMPTDPVHLSFWLVRNLHLSENMTRTIFTTDSVNQRMKLIANTFKQDAIFTCRFCGNRIANCNELFPMSKHGVQTQYCNAAGYIHEINTVYHLLRNAVRYSGRASTEFSWFPGYQWHIILCKICSRHIGWEFKSLEPNLVPKTFYGISRSTVRISTQVTDTPAVIYRNFMQLARNEMQ